jgi:hypothetical protein
LVLMNELKQITSPLPRRLISWVAERCSALEAEGFTVELEGGPRPAGANGAAWVFVTAPSGAIGSVIVWNSGELETQLGDTSGLSDPDYSVVESGDEVVSACEQLIERLRSRA